MSLRSVNSRVVRRAIQSPPWNGICSSPTAGCGVNTKSFPPLASSGLRSVLEQGYGHTFGYLRTSSTLASTIFVEEETKCGNEVNHNDQALTPQETREFMEQVLTFLSTTEKRHRTMIAAHKRMAAVGLENNVLLEQIMDELMKISKSSPKPAGYETLLVAWGFKPPEQGIWRKVWFMSFLISVLLAQSFFGLRMYIMVRDLLSATGTSL